MREIRCSGTPVKSNLPLEPDVFVGRAAELAGLSRALEGSRLVTVTGPRGIGKSRLAVRAAASAVPRDGVWREGPAALTGPECVDHLVVAALRVPDLTGRPTREVLLD